jgi:hypothetical protein
VPVQQQAAANQAPVGAEALPKGVVEHDHRVSAEHLVVIRRIHERQLAVLVSDINPIVQPAPTTPALTIVSMGGFPVTRYAASLPDLVDLLMPAALAERRARLEAR